MEHFHLANCLFVDEEYSQAIEKYTAALEIIQANDPDSLSSSSISLATILGYRAAANLKLKKYTQALQDCNQSLILDPTQEPVYYRKGLSCFELEEFETAKKNFEIGLGLRIEAQKDTTAYSRAIRKCETELLESKGLQAEGPPTKKTSVAVPTPEKVATSSSASSSSIVPAVATRYEYYQDADRLCLSVLAKNVDPKDAEITIEVDHLRVKLTRNGVEEVVVDKQLNDSVDTEKSRYEIRKAKIEIILYKVEKGIWPSLEGSGPKKAAKPAAVASATQPALLPDVPASRPKAYASQKDWDKVSSSIVKELEAEKPEGEEALQVLFRDIYSKADEDTRRAMNKSFQTSGGTVLSTNWKEVGKKNYEEEKQAPKGMEWRNWEGDKLKQIED